MRNFLSAVCVATLLVAPSIAVADVALPPVFADHMVLQREMPVAVWGTAAAGEKVTVAFRGQSQSTTAKADGAWRVALLPMKADADQKPSDLVVQAGNTITFTDVLVGEVWLGSGQSNMAWQAGKQRADVDAANYPQLRLYADAQWPDRKHTWKPCTPQTASAYPSIMFYMGSRLHQDLNVPVGIITTGVGGSASSSWLSPAAFMAEPRCRDAWKQYTQVTYPRLNAEFGPKMEAWQKRADAAKAAGGSEPKGKPRPPQVGTFPSAPDCGVWYAKFIAPLAGYTIRGVVWDQGEAWSGMVDVPWDASVSAMISDWRKTWGYDFPLIFVQKPSGGGWEGAGAAPNARGEASPADLPKSPAEVAAGGYERETYLSLLKIPKSAVAVAMDLGGGLHPDRKDRYGNRCATVALGFVYGQKVPYLAPTYASHAVEGRAIRVKFANAGKTLVARGDRPPQGFAIAGEDGNFVWADARIDGDAVLVSNPSVAKPVAVRYAWASNPTWANLFNDECMPALTFRTDTWANTPPK